MYNYLKLQIILFLLGLYRRQLDVFQFLEDVSRSCRLLNSVWRSVGATTHKWP